jgi:hypothetical protein
MIHRESLFDIFDAIATQQAENTRRGEYGKAVLVFVDEINARLDNDYTYGAFLAPLENCFYVRDGRNISLRPCIWLFAGTRLNPDQLKAHGRDQTTRDPGGKISDFKSRITIFEEIDFDSLKDVYRKDDTKMASWTTSEQRLDLLSREARLEQVYLGVSMINRTFPDVRRVSKDVLFGFWKLDPEKSPSRTLRKLALAFNNVQYGVIRRENWEDQYTDIAADCLPTEQKDSLWLPDGAELVELRFRAAECEA